MPSRRTTRPDTNPFVVYVTYPNNPKEYAYLCNFPAKQGDVVLGNSNVHVTVKRTANFDPIATKYVNPLPDHATLALRERRFAIVKRLNEIEAEHKELDRFKALAHVSPEAKRLIAELKRISA